GVEQDPFERPLPELTDQQPLQKLLLRFSGPREQPGERFGAPRRRASSFDRADLLEGRIDFAERQARFRRRRRALEPVDRGVAEPDFPLAELAGEESDGDFYLVGREPRQTAREQLDFPAARARFRYRA